MKRIVLTFGLISGAILVAMMLVTQLFMDRIGFERGEIVGYTTMVLAFLMIFTAVRTCRDDACGGRIGFGRAFLVGLLVTLVASACYVVAWEFIYYLLAPDFGEKYGAYVVEQLRKSGASAAQVDAKVRAMAEFNAMYRNPLVNVAMTFLEPLPVGLLFTLVAALVFGRRRPQTAAAAAA